MGYLVGCGPASRRQVSSIIVTCYLFRGVLYNRILLFAVLSSGFSISVLEIFRPRPKLLKIQPKNHQKFSCWLKHEVCFFLKFIDLNKILALFMTMHL